MQKHQHQKKKKLRTASEVLSRLRWAGDEESSMPCLDNTLIGYSDRLNGPMEKAAADFIPIDDGGHLPEHRIQYFRTKSLPLEQGIFWDRAGRVDRLFGSGNGKAPPSCETIMIATEAIVNMKRLAEEKAIRAEEKAKMKARRQAKKAAMTRRLIDLPSCNTVMYDDNFSPQLKHHSWENLQAYHFFKERKCQWMIQPCSSQRKSQVCESDSLKLISWNVLFDMMRNEKNEFIQGDNSLLADTDSTFTRWGQILSELEHENATIVALQEVTPRFIEQLQNQRWVKEKYALSSGMNDLNCIDPFGNLIMWKKYELCPTSLFLCKDLHRYRATVVSFQLNQNTHLNVANIHLPSDTYDYKSKSIHDRTFARQREISAIIAKLLFLGQSQEQHKSIPLIIGDFNSDLDLVPNEYFEDSWILSTVDHPGLTYNWKVNKRAEKLRSLLSSTKEPRRIDRIYVGCNFVQRYDEAKLLGNTTTTDFPPSDHFGVCVRVTLKSEVHEQRDNMDCNVWSKVAVPSTDSLLALVFNDSGCNGVPFYDSSSTLPIAHVTLLNGFVDISSKDRHLLATHAVQDAVKQAFSSNKDSSDLFELYLDKDSFRIFEHGGSATLVCCPDIHSQSGEWLSRLYNTLRAKFVSCHEQESRFLSGWTPHFSLGSFGTAAEARIALSQIVSENSWYDEGGIMSVYGIGLFQRDVNDGKLYLSTSIPLAKKKPILHDAGVSLSSSMRGASYLVLQEIERACRFVNKTKGRERLKLSVDTYGSHRFGLTLPGISDVDAIVTLKAIFPSDDSFVKTIICQEFLNSVSSRLCFLHNSCKARIRVSKTSEGDLNILTIKIAQYPSVDLLVCCLSSNGLPVNNQSKQATNILKDSDELDARINSFQRPQVILGALRIIKLWANQRNIYGAAKSGFLGGSAWVILLLWLLSRHGSNNQEVSKIMEEEEQSLTVASQQLASYFFRHLLSSWSNETIIHLGDVESVSRSSLIDEARDTAIKRNSMAVIAPVSLGNFGKSSTHSTTLVTNAEILRAQRIIERNDGNFDVSVLEPFKHEGLFLSLEVKFSSTSRPSEVKAWGFNQTLSLIVALEKVVDPNVIRPVSSYRRHENSFTFQIGMKDSSEPTKQCLETFIHEYTLILEEGRKVFIPDGKVLLRFA